MLSLRARISEFFKKKYRAPSTFGYNPVYIFGLSKKNRVSTKISKSLNNNDKGSPIFIRHLHAYLLDQYFVKLGVERGGYKKHHISKPYFPFEVSMNGKGISGYSYKTIDGITEFESPDYDYSNDPYDYKFSCGKILDELSKFKELMKKAGYNFSKKDCNQGAWAGGMSVFQDIVYNGPLDEDQLSNDWKVVNFTTESTPFNKKDFNQFIKENRKSIEKELGSIALKILENPNPTVILRYAVKGFSY